MRIGEVIAMAAIVVTILVTLILAGELQTIAETMDFGTEAQPHTLSLPLAHPSWHAWQYSSVAY